MTDLEAKLTQHLLQLAVEIGTRPLGSAANHAAARYIRDVFQSFGLAVEEQPFACRVWQDEETILELDGKPAAASANAFSPPCDISAPLVPMGSMAELEAAELTGRIGVLYGDLTKGPLGVKAFPYKDERDIRIVQLLEEKSPSALITVQTGGELNRLIEDWEFLIPSATVPARTGLALLSGQPKVRLCIKSHQSPGEACNVVARQAGSTPARIVLCAHFDTKVDTPGANDNAAGVAVLLGLTQILSQKQHTLGLEFIAFNGEEYMPIGDDEYLRRCGDSLPQIVAAINADGVGQYLGANSITMITASQPFQDYVAGLTRQYPGVVWVEPWPQSNHSTFAWRGVPSIALSTTGAVNLTHLRTDTVEWISPAKLREVTLLVADIVEGLQDKSVEWTRNPG
jgi:Iap family predicted aminopeptidase